MTVFETHHCCSFEVTVGNQSHVKSRSANGVSCLHFSSAWKCAGSSATSRAEQVTGRQIQILDLNFPKPRCI